MWSENHLTPSIAAGLAGILAGLLMVAGGIGATGSTTVGALESIGHFSGTVAVLVLPASLSLSSSLTAPAPAGGEEGTVSLVPTCRPLRVAAAPPSPSRGPDPDRADSQRSSRGLLVGGVAPRGAGRGQAPRQCSSVTAAGAVLGAGTYGP